jgi:integrase
VLAEGEGGFHSFDSSVLGERQDADGKSVESRLHQPPKQSKLNCPQCGSERLYKDGMRYLSNGKSTQRWLWRECFYRFSEPRQQSKPSQKTSEWQLNTASALPLDCQERGESRKQRAQTLQTGGLTLVTIETRQINAPREGTTQPTENAVRIVEYLLYLKKKGREEITLKTVNRRLTQLSRHADLLNPETVKDFLSTQNKLSKKTKAIDTSIYSGFLKFHKIFWEPPEYKPERKPCILPYEEDLEQLISGTGRRLSLFLLVLKETAARKGEAAPLQWTDIDFNRKLISIASEKGGNPRTLPISDRLTEVLRSQNKETDKVFNATLSSISSNYYQ